MPSIRLALVLAVPALVAACGTPQEQCIRQNTRELRQVERLIVETQGNLARGYGFEERTVTDWDWEPCFPAPRPVKGQAPAMCWEPTERVERKAVAIDPASEKRKLDALVQRQTALTKAASSAIASCRAQYPE